VRIVERGLATTPGGIDATAYRNLGLDMRATVAFIETTLPDYPAFEAYVRANARMLDTAAIARHNVTRVDTRPDKARLEKGYVRWENATNWSYLIDDLIDWRLIYDILTGGELPDWAEPRA
jgi:hypothetical protein